MGSVNESISDRRYAPGRRSACIVPMKSGNRAHRDPSADSDEAGR